MVNKGKAIQFIKKHWYLGVSRNFSFFQSCINCAGHYLYSKEYGIIPKEVIYIVKEGRMAFTFLNNENTQEYFESIEEISLHNIKKLEKVYYCIGKQLKHASAILEKYSSRESFESYILAAEKMAAGLYITNEIGRHMSKVLIAELEAANPKLPKNEIDILASVITYPSKLTPLTKSQIDLLNIGTELQKRKIGIESIDRNPNLKRRLKNYIQTYSVIPVNFNENPWTKKEVLNQLRSLMKTDCKQEAKNILLQHKGRRETCKKTIFTIKMMRIRKIAEALQIGTYLNEFRKYMFCYASLAYRPLFSAIAKKYGLKDWQECWKFTPDEIISLHFEHKRNILQVLPSRNLAGVIFADNSKGYRILAKHELELFLSEIERTIPSETLTSTPKELTGVIANKGIVRGTVRVILGKHDFNKFKDRDIIVTTMTSVDFIPLMKHASAFVTNEGGITSHASIVSREMNKPCIIGTKIATRVLKDGDYIEVDANKGVVRKIKRG